MKKTILLLGTAVIGLVGCATDRDYVRHGDRHYVAEEHPGDRTVIVHRDGSRTYVRDYEYNRRDSLDFQSNMEPRVRGKHAEALGWNTENYYLQRGYRDW